MIFDISCRDDKFIDKICRQSVKELDEFYKVKLAKPTFRVVIVPDRKTIDAWRGEESPNWWVGWADDKKTIYLLDRKNYESESCHKYSEMEYTGLLKHEIAHLYYSNLVGSHLPVWLTEGASLYLAGQVDARKPVKEFKVLLDCYKKLLPGLYTEAGYAVKVLVEKFGENKLKKFLKSINSEKISPKFVSDMFKKVYGFELSHETLNKLLVGYE